MKEWVPFFQTLIWIIFLALLLYNSRNYVANFLSAILKRIEEGSGFGLGPGGLSLSEVREKAEEATENASLVRRAYHRGHWNILGEMFRLHKKWKDGIFSFNQAIITSPNYPDAFVGLGAIYRDQSKEPQLNSEEKQRLLKMALDKCGKAIELSNGRFGPAYLTRATVLCLLNQELANVRKDLETAIDLDPDLKEFITEEPEFEVLKDEEWFKNFSR